MRHQQHIGPEFFAAGNVCHQAVFLGQFNVASQQRRRLPVVAAAAAATDTQHTAHAIAFDGRLVIVNRRVQKLERNAVPRPTLPCRTPGGRTQVLEFVRIFY